MFLRLYFFIPEPTFFSSIEKFFISQLVLGIEWKWCNKTSSFFLHQSNKFSIDFIDLTILKAISVWRIGDNDSFGNWIFYKISCRKIDIIENSSSFGISLRYLYHLRIDITRYDRIFSTWIDLASRSILYIQEYFCIEKSEFFYTKMSRKSRCNISSNHHSLDRNRSRTTERINKWGRVFPVCKCNECSSKIFFDGSFSSFSSVSSFMKGVTSDIKEDMSNVINNQDEYVHLSSVGSIWGIECREYSSLTDTLKGWNTLKNRSRRRSFDDDSLFSCQIFTPIECREGIIEGVKIFCFFSWKFNVDTIRKSTPDEEFVHITICSSTGYESILSLDFFASESFTFSFYERFESRLAGENESPCFSVLYILHGHECTRNRENSKLSYRALRIW